MWKKNETRDYLVTQHRHRHKAELEIFKAVAQAWLSHHNGNPSKLPPNEFDARRMNFRGKPSRFGKEASRKIERNWDFSQSLLDPYEVVAVSKRLEEGLVFENNGICGVFLEEESGVFGARKRKESKNSLRNLFNMVSGRSRNG